ncbi:heat-inducible transcription repressor HrcA, partial [Megasphaera massiliensis]|nr:heat-inducible transcription repressor HrcA [Megasphaera massiliensis]
MITHNFTLIMASERLNSKLKYIRILPLDDRRAIMIVVTDTGQVENCIYPKPRGASMDDLNIIAQKLTN